MDVELTQSVLNNIDLLIVNEVEAMDLMSVTTIDEAKQKIASIYPDLAILMTLGSEGVRYLKSHQDEFVAAFKVDAIDTTAAGDTFIGFCLAALSQGASMVEAMKRGCAASAICVTQIGASPSIPTKQMVDKILTLNS